MTDLEEFQWYSGELEKARTRLARAHAEFGDAMRQVDRLEREQGVIFKRLALTSGKGDTP